MTTTMNTQNTTFIFRNKFEKFLNDENRSVITSAFETFCRFNSGKALSVLWQLTYKPREVPFYFEELGLEIEQISDEMLPVLVSELRFQYQNLHPDFCKVSIPDALKEAFTDFANATNNIVAKHVYDRCSGKLYNPNELEINLDKMVNEKAYQETRQKAIRFLGFGLLEAEYLYPFRKPLHDFVQKMYELKMLPLSQPMANTPFAGLDKKLQDAGFEISDDDSALPFEFSSDTSDTPDNLVMEEPVQTTSKFKRLIAEAVIMHKDVFTSLVQNNDMNALVQIGGLGFDLNEVIAKKQQICNLIDAIEEKEKAEKKLFEAHEALNGR